MKNQNAESKKQAEVEENERAARFCQSAQFEQYMNDYKQYLLLLEDRFTFPTHFFNESKITPEMRIAALNWLSQLFVRFDLLPETQQIAIYLFDRCLINCQNTLEEVNLALVGLACMILAIKVDAVGGPSISDCANYLVARLRTFSTPSN
ncbi:unnamed protein product, partial [Gongylonema pulchrum]|uniref:CYCLIN domain-containing protein n=1 Tax=Gongylonema pulchrum TaxID=637853 RepID=A0A183EVZ1_9BILA